MRKTSKTGLGFNREKKSRITKLENDSHKRIVWETEKEALNLNCIFCVWSVLLVSSGAVNLQNKTIVSETENNEVVVWKPIRKFFLFLCFFFLIPDTLENVTEILQRMLPIHYLLQILSGNSLTLYYDLHWKTHHLLSLFPLLSHICTSALLASFCLHSPALIFPPSPPFSILNLHLHSFAMYSPVLGAYVKPYIE